MKFNCKLDEKLFENNATSLLELSEAWEYDAKEYLANKEVEADA